MKITILLYLFLLCFVCGSAYADEVTANSAYPRIYERRTVASEQYAISRDFWGSN